MNGTIADCARAALTHEALKRVEAKLPVAWYQDGYERRAVSRDDKFTGAWLVQGNGWESYYPAASVEAEIRQAEGFPFEQPEAAL